MLRRLLMLFVKSTLINKNSLLLVLLRRLKRSDFARGIYYSVALALAFFVVFVLIILYIEFRRYLVFLSFHELVMYREIVEKGEPPSSYMLALPIELDKTDEKDLQELTQTVRETGKLLRIFFNKWKSI